MITHIVNENFKSYAGVQTLGPFHKVLGYMLHSEIILAEPPLDQLLCPA
jgi:hypothetical protein